MFEIVKTQTMKHEPGNGAVYKENDAFMVHTPWHTFVTGFT